MSARSRGVVQHPSCLSRKDSGQWLVASGQLEKQWSVKARIFTGHSQLALSLTGHWSLLLSASYLEGVGGQREEQDEILTVIM